jgi:hypothetical protein
MRNTVLMPVVGALDRMPSWGREACEPAAWAEWFRELLDAVQEVGRRFTRGLLQTVLDRTVVRRDRWAKECGQRYVRCPNCGSEVWFYDQSGAEEKGFHSLSGNVSLMRYPVRCRCGKHFYPLDTILGLGRHTMFPLLQRVSTFLAAVLPDALAARVLKMTTGAPHAPNTVAARALELGQAAVARQKDDMELEVQHLQEAARQIDGPVDGHLSVDGLMVPLNEKPKEEDGSHKEARVAVLTLKDSEGKVIAKIRIARLTDLSVFLKSLSLLVEDAAESIPNLRRFYLHADGAPWIMSFATTHEFLQFILDWYHLKEKVWSLASESGFDRTPHRMDRLKEIVDALWQGRPAHAVRLLKNMRFPYASLRETRDDIVSYIDQRKAQLPNYKWYSERSMTIGSGEVEGAGKHVIANRLKGSGMRWRADHADAIMAARCSIFNETWEHDLIQANLYH